MVFTLEEIKNYLLSHKTIADAIDKLSEQAITDCNDYPTSFNYAKTPANADKYEAQIGMAKLKEEQQTIYNNSNGSKGKYWMACSPRWITDDTQKQEKARKSTEYEILYWVNYGDDETYGWFTVEQIKEWLTTPDLKLYTLGGTRERKR